ncbi:hypothetical protein HXX76_003691 [Chlamydomonas incerta]|uniref:Uncharacterized protein n=1 Tax=Chlamydomonas incerta TaxID=51695 RepID=A0A835TB61_CHLIN|nr:hypothetical protein HXX76_003691 [Chlamydomonas incerta]|eukprot:KAG2440836.1 hypothetical protein HXX76_003691 [Chlamydomonas incerta]
MERWARKGRRLLKGGSGGHSGGGGYRVGAAGSGGGHGGFNWRVLVIVLSCVFGVCLLIALLVVCVAGGRRVGVRSGAYSTGGASGGTSSSGNSSRGAFNWRALVIALSATFGLVLLIILLWWINRRYKAKHGRSLWARRSSRVVDENQEDAGAPPPPPPVDITKIPGVIVLSAYPPPDGPPHAEKGIAAGGESAAGLGAAETPAALGLLDKMQDPSS